MLNNIKSHILKINSTFRVDNSLKNILIFLPFFLSNKAIEFVDVYTLTIGFLIFSIVTSVCYATNNFIDRAKDKINKLKYLDISIYFPFQSGEDRILKNIEQCKNLEEIHSNVGECTNHEETRWVTIDVDVTSFKTLKNLKKLDLSSIDQTLVKKLEKLETLEEFELVNPCMITENMGSDDGTVHDPMTEKDLEFLKHSKKLKKLKIFFPRFGEEKINVDSKKFFSFINPNLEDIEINCSNGKEELHFATDFYLEIINRFKNIKKIDLDINCRNAPELKYDEKVEGAEDIALAKQEKNAKNPVKIDFKDLIKHKSLEQLKLRFDSYIGTRLFNVQEIVNLKAKKIGISEEKFKTEDLEKIFDKIVTKRQKFLLDFNKKNKGEEVLSAYKLDEENKKLYDEVEDEDENEFIGTDYESSLRSFYKMFIQMGRKGWDADVIGNRVKNILGHPKPKIRHVLTPNRLQNYTLPGILPDRIFDKLIGKALGLIKK